MTANQYSSFPVRPDAKTYIDLYCYAHGWDIVTFFDILSKQLKEGLDLEALTQGLDLQNMTRKELEELALKLRDDLKFSDIWVVQDVRKFWVKPKETEKNVE